MFPINNDCWRCAWPVGGQLTARPNCRAGGISRRQFFNWVGRLKRDGVAGLLANNHRGGRHRPRSRARLLEAFQAGLKVGCWKRAKEFQHWLRSEHQRQVGVERGDITGWENWAGS